MEVAKSFERNGVRYRPGDALPGDLDKEILAHYLRHGMVREARLPAPAETKPATPARRQRTPQPAKPQDVPKPEETKAADTAQAGDADGTQQAAGAPADEGGQTVDAAAVDAAANPAADAPQEPVQQSLGAESV